MNKAMMNKAHFSAPGYYRIEFQGLLRSDLFERLGSLQISSGSSEENDAITILQGRVSDQAELAGILNTLYEFHLPLLAVQYLGDDPPVLKAKHNSG